MENWIPILILVLLLVAVEAKFGLARIGKEMAATALDMAEGYNEQYRVDDVDGTKKAE